MQNFARQQIISFLEKHRSATAEDISRNLKIPKPNIHYHLRKLVREGVLVVQPLADRAHRSRGRPTLHYQINNIIAAENIFNLLEGLLDLFFHNHLDEQSRQHILSRLAENMFPAIPATRSLTTRLNLIVAALNQSNYQARWEAGKSGPLIYFRNCPYASIIKRHPELCDLDCCVLENFLKLKMTQVVKIDLKSPGSVCIFSPMPVEN